jgi:hypothetical protein
LVNLDTECDKFKGVDTSVIHSRNRPPKEVRDVRNVYGMIKELSANISTWNTEYTIVQRVPLEVKGEGYECFKMLIKAVSWVNFFGARASDVEKRYVKLTREECNIMVKTKKCDNNDMHCDAAGMFV